MITTQAQPIHRQFHSLRHALGLRTDTTAELLGVTPGTISHWDRGFRTPSTAHAITYAHALDHRLVITRNGHVIGDLADWLPRLHELREQAGLSQRGMAHLACTGKTAVHDVEAQGRAGKARLSSVAWYLTTLGCQIELMHADRLELAA